MAVVVEARTPEGRRKVTLQPGKLNECKVPKGMMRKVTDQEGNWLGFENKGDIEHVIIDGRRVAVVDGGIKVENGNITFYAKKYPGVIVQQYPETYNPEEEIAFPLTINGQTEYCPATWFYEEDKPEKDKNLEPFIAVPQGETVIPYKVNTYTEECKVPIEELQTRWDTNERLKNGIETVEKEISPGQIILCMPGFISINTTNNCVEIRDSEIEIMQAIPLAEIDGSFQIYLVRKINGKKVDLKGELKTRKKEPNCSPVFSY